MKVFRHPLLKEELKFKKHVLIKRNVIMQPIIPFEPIITDTIPSGNQWIAQVKWDGTRILSYFDGKQITLYNRKKNDKTNQYPELLDPSFVKKVKSFILDGEVIAMHEGKPSFYHVMKRDKTKNLQDKSEIKQQIPITYMIFDLPFLNGKWITDKPLYERQKLLKEIITPNKHIQLVENFLDKEGLVNVCLENDLEGVIFKDLNSTYVVNGKDNRWLKKKKTHDLIAVVGGVSYKNNIVNSLHLGLYNDKNQLIYIGSAGTGKLTRKDWQDITKAIESIILEKTPFHNPMDNRNFVWLKPVLTVKVSYLEWINGQKLRHPIIESFVIVPVKECKLITR